MRGLDENKKPRNPDVVKKELMKKLEKLKKRIDIEDRSNFVNEAVKAELKIKVKTLTAVQKKQKIQKIILVLMRKWKKLYEEFPTCVCRQTYQRYFKFYFK